MFDVKTTKATVGGREASFETGRIARRQVVLSWHSMAT